MRILSFDTSSEAVQVALLADGAPLAEYTQSREQASEGDPPRQQAGTVLLPMIDRALKENDWEKGSVECLVVGAGPGSFTGIRTGVVTARTLAQALELPLVAVCLLECFACAAPLPQAIVLAASRGYCFAAAYDRDESAPSSDQNLIDTAKSQGSTEEPWGRLPYLRELIAPSYVPFSELSALLEGVASWAVAQEAMDAVPAGVAEISPLPKVKNIAMQQAQIAWNRLSLTLSKETERENSLTKQRLIELFPYTNVQPLYLRSPSVTVKSNRQAAANSQASHGNENQANAPGRHR